MIVVDQEQIADQLIAAGGPGGLAALRPQLDLGTVAALKRRVDAAKLRDAGRALEIAAVADAVAAALADPAAVALAGWARGNALYHLSRYHEALDAFRGAEAYYVERGDDFSAACLQINQVAVLQDTGAFAAALATAERARAACARLGDAARLEAILEMNSGAAYQQLARPAEALAAYERGRARLVSLGDAVETARIDINRANVLQEIGRFAEAEALYRGSAEALAGLDQEVARAEHNLGKLAYRRGRYQEALAHLERARAGFAAIPIPLEVAKSDLYRALVYRDLNLLAETVALAEAARRSFERARTAWELAVALIVEGTALARLGDPGGAGRLLARARRLLRRQGALERLPALDLDRAALALAAGAHGTARRIAGRVARRIDAQTWPGLAARADLLLAACALDGPQPDLPTARRRAQAALAAAERHGLPELAPAWHALARAQAAAGAAEAAAAALRSARDAAEELRRRLPVDDLQLAYLDERRAIYRDALALALRSGPPDAALVALDLALAAPAPRPPAPAASPDAARRAALRERWSWLQTQLEGLDERRGAGEGARLALDAERRAIEADLADLALRRDVGASAAATSLPAAPADMALLASLRARLAADEALLAFAPAGPQMAALLVTREGAAIEPALCELAALGRLLRSWRFHVEHAYAVAGPEALAAARAHLARFHAALLAPLAPRLAGLRRLAVVLPPEWHDLPLAAAYDGRSHLVERLELAYLSAPSALPARDGAPAPGPALVVGCSDDGRLPAAPAEARAVAAALAPASLLIEGEATRARLLAALPEAGLVHLASHAAYRPDNPLFSWVRLADGPLSVAEIGELRLAGRPLITLSACETGRGRPFGGGLLGLGRGLLLAGARALVLSLWKIADESSARLMADFYGGPPLPRVDPAAALAAAQRAAIGRGEHPFHWAAFICVEG